MTQIEVPDWVVEVACSAAFVEFSENQRADMRAAITAALGAWVVPSGFRYRVAPTEASRNRPWTGSGVLGEWNDPMPPDSKCLQCQPLYTLRQEKPE